MSAPTDCPACGHHLNEHYPLGCVAENYDDDDGLAHACGCDLTVEQIAAEYAQRWDEARRTLSRMAAYRDHMQRNGEVLVPSWLVYRRLTDILENR